MTCIDCAFAAKENPSSGPVSLVELRDDNRYEVTCDKGHTVSIVLQAQRFELLFEIGSYAILDGYYREAVNSYTAALERAREFFVRVVVEEKGLPFEELWKPVQNRSERQLGVFVTAFLLETGTPAAAVSQKDESF